MKPIEYPMTRFLSCLPFSLALKKRGRARLGTDRGHARAPEHIFDYFMARASRKQIFLFVMPNLLLSDQ